MQIVIRSNYFLMVPVLILFMFFVTRASAWGSSGHALLCEIAWQNLTEKTQAWIEPLYKERGFDTFAQSCNWADQIRGDDRFNYLASMHYVNVAKGASEYSQEIAICGKKSCVTKAITTHIINLKTEQKNLSQSLLLLSHFVGDIHQPLHVSYAQDWGGNKIKIAVENKFGAVLASNLHQIWDSWLLETLSLSDWRQAANSLNKNISNSQKQTWSEQQDVHLWAKESYEQVKLIYAQLDSTRKVTTQYADKYADYVRQRLQIAGIRLAALLNSMTD